MNLKQLLLLENSNGSVFSLKQLPVINIRGNIFGTIRFRNTIGNDCSDYLSSRPIYKPKRYGLYGIAYNVLAKRHSV